METREFPVLGESDQAVVDSFAVGLDRDAARVLAYLALRATPEHDGGPAATRLAIRVGTGLGRSAVADALDSLEAAGLVAVSTASRPTRGRPPQVWQPVGDRDELLGRVRRIHARALLNRTADIAAAFGTDTAGLSLTDGDAASDDATVADAITADATDAVPDDAAAVTRIDTDPDTGADTTDAAAETVRVGLNWTPNGFHAPLFVAARDGHYGDVDIDVSFDAASGSTMALEWVREGRTDVGIAGSATLCRALQSDAAVLPVALLYQRAMTVLYTTREVFGTPLTSVEQLRGCTVGMPADAETALLARLFLSQAGVLEDVTVVDTCGEERTTLLEGSADVVTGMAADPPTLEEAGHTVDSMLVSEQFPVPGQALVVRTETLAERPTDVERFLAGTMAGWTTAVRDPRDAARAVAGRSGDPVESERRRLAVALETFAASDATRNRGWGWQPVEDWQRLVTAMRRTDLSSR